MEDNEMKINPEVAMSPMHDRIASLENGFEKMFHLLERIAPLASMIPGASPIVAGVVAVGDVIEHAIESSNGAQAVDSAALAAGHIAHSTGNEALDARLAAIETCLELASPLFQYMASEFGLNAPANFVSPASAYAQTFNAEAPVA